MATHSSILAWKISWTEETGGLQSIGGKEWDMTERLTHTHTHTHTHEAIIFQMNNAWRNRIMNGLKNPFQGQISPVDLNKTEYEKFPGTVSDSTLALTCLVLYRRIYKILCKSDLSAHFFPATYLTLDFLQHRYQISTVWIQIHVWKTVLLS